MRHIFFSEKNAQFIQRKFSFIFFLLLATYCKAQTKVSAPMTGTPPAGAYYSSSQIQLLPPFSFTASSGFSLHLYINSADCPILTTAPSYEQNYIVTSVYRSEMNSVTGAGLTACDIMQTIQYFDGLGRPLQTIQVRGNSDATKDLIQPFAYDAFGREVTNYLPYAASYSNGQYRVDALMGTQNEYYNPSGIAYSTKQLPNKIAHITTPYSKTGYEASPLDRVVEQGAPGEPWQLTGAVTSNESPGHSLKTEFVTNNTLPITDTSFSRLVILYNISSIDGTSQLRTLVRSMGGNMNYGVGELAVTVTKDENWRNTGFGNSRGGTKEEYKDREGHIVLKRTFNWKTTPSPNMEILSTYYVYDDFGNLSYVLPPGATPDLGVTSALNQSILDNFCYQYRYDALNRLTQKKLPGKAWEFIVYNKLNQIVATQDGNQRNKNIPEWTVTKYDAQGRVATTGIYTFGSSGADVRATLQNTVNGQITMWETPNGTVTNYGYTNLSFPATITTTLSVNYYDDYKLTGTNPYPYVAGSNMTKGLLTGSLTNVLGTTSMLWGVNYYDEKGRAIKTFKQHYLGGGTSNMLNYDEISSTYNFNNQVTVVTRKHYTANGSNGTPGIVIANTYDYDHMGRKTTSYEQISTPTQIGANVLMSKNDYNDIGQLTTKHLHGTTDSTPFLQDIDYSYNERGWLTMINNPTGTPSDAKIFGITLNYNSGATAQFNGNISGISWLTKVPPGLGLSQSLQSYTYTYDNLNRLKLAHYTTPGIINKFDEEISYDPSGNILTLKRKNLTTSGVYLNNLNYNYTTSGAGNKLWSVTDAGTANQSGTYTYDDNGNTKTDSRNQITDISYNLVNLPQVVSRPAGNLSFIYDAAGTKLRRISGGVARDYVAGIEYNNGVIEQVATEEGRAIFSNGVYNYEYFLKDHLGNTRAIVRQDGSIGQVQDYYAFGLEMASGNTYFSSPNNNYKYHGKEKQEETGQYDYGARFYDPIVARWTSIDPHSERYESITPYNYVFNNPLRFIDDNGQDPGDLVVILTGAMFSSSQRTTSTINQIANSIRHNINGGVVEVYDTHYSRSDNTSTESAFQSILKSHKANPKGRIAVYGYSYGGVLANYLTKRLKKAGIKVDVLVTVDAANGPHSHDVDRRIANNVKANFNFYELGLGSLIGSYGSANYGEPGTHIENDNLTDRKYNGENIQHDTIDEATAKEAIGIISSILSTLKEGEKKDLTKDEIKKLFGKK